MNNMSKYITLCRDLETKLISECTELHDNHEYCTMLGKMYNDCIVYRDKKIKCVVENKTNFA